MEEIRKAVGIALQIQREAKEVSDCLSGEYASSDGWRDDVAESFFRYTSPVARKADELVYCVPEAERACSRAAMYDAEREGRELSGLQREVAAL